MLPKSHTPAPTAAKPARPGDATLTVAKAARILGVHPNTIRAWSDAGRLRHYRINDRGDRRYRLTDLQHFLAAAASDAVASPGEATALVPRGPRHGAPLASTLTESQAGLDLLADLAEIASFPSGLDPALDEACRRVRTATGAALVGVWERRPGGLVQRAVATESGPGSAARTMPEHNAMVLALESSEPIHARPGTVGPTPALGLGTDELIVRIPGGEVPWGLLVLAGAVQLGPDDGRRLATAIARTISVIVRSAAASEQASSRLRRSEALRRVATDLASRLDVGDVARDLCDHARVLFGADRVVVALDDDKGRVVIPSSVGFSAAFVDLARETELARAGQHDVPPRRPVQLLGDDAVRSATSLRAAGLQEGVETLVAAPLVDGHELYGTLYLGHDRRFRWRDVDLDAAEALAGDAAIAIRSARTFGRMAAWAAQLQAIQRLGARLSGLSTEQEIGHAIATELRQLIEYDNVRVYRVRGDMLVPVAWLGLSADYTDEKVDDLTVRVGEGITGWVARYRVPQLVDDSANDPRAITIPGTKPDADESMLLAPMVHEGSCLGVVALAYGALRHFTEDDLRLLVIYASFAAQAMANADATERLREQADALERQLRAQRELLGSTEAILTTLDAGAVLDQITGRLGALIACDNMAIEVVDGSTGRLKPLTARGVHEQQYLEPWAPGEEGIATWVVARNEPVLVEDELTDPRVNRFRNEPVDGSLIVVPLLGPRSAAGVLTLERLGRNRPFSPEEFDLVKLFAAQVSIALRNAEVFQAAEVRASTDGLTGLLNHLAFKQQLERSVVAAEPFGLVIIDLDEFSAFNETPDLHQDGDRALREIASAIRGAARETDAVFRYGGDEFAVLLPRSGTDGLAQVASRIQAAVRAVGGPGTRWDELGLKVSASIGTSSYPVDGPAADDVLLAADRACRVAKLRGHDRICTAREGLALADGYTLSDPTPVDAPTLTE
jgi:diguanylate cyclase (GGDEF)-like protein/excisionase family DNA binding protein